MKTTYIFTDKELESYGFEIVKGPCLMIDGLFYYCKITKIVGDITKEEFDKNFTKDLIACMMLDEGITHVGSVTKNEFVLHNFKQGIITSTEYVNVSCNGIKITTAEEENNLIESELKELLKELNERTEQ